jgi:hypothetical protein
VGTPDNDPHRDQKNLIVAAAVIILVVVSIWLMLLLKKSDAVMDCLARHRSNCVPVDTGQ